MKYDPKIHHRRSIRLPGYDYTRAGAYYVTLVTQGRLCLFGDVVNGVMVLNEFGRIAAETWQWLERQYSYVELGLWVVMPKHLHGIIILHEPGRGGSRSAPTADGTGPFKPKPLGGLVGAFKTVCTKKINILRKTEGAMVWQRNYYEHIIRNDQDHKRIQLYIQSNPENWTTDSENHLETK